METNTSQHRVLIKGCQWLLIPALISLEGCIGQFTPELLGVKRATVVVDSVKRGPMTVQALGLGYLRSTGHGRFKAELSVPAAVVDDILPGQMAFINTHNTIISGQVARIHPLTPNGVAPVDVSFSGDLPKDARDGWQVGGTIVVGHLDDVLYIRRPAFGQIRSNVPIFKLDADGKTATRVRVKLGQASAENMQILDGLNEGDKVILSDMSRYDSFDRIRLVD